jgi:tetratricopeptide (TPR) repeat protein
MTKGPLVRLASVYKRVLLASSLLVITTLVRAQLVSDAGVLEGTIRDSKSRPVVGASVTLRSSQGEQRNAQSDQHGLYLFAGLGTGDFEIRAEISGGGASTARCTIEPNRTKKLDLTLSPEKTSSALEFSVDPKFTVSGVTDASSAGSHGSSASAPTTEALARATVALGTETPSSNIPVDEKLLTAADTQPEDFAANREAGLMLARAEKPQQALPYLERASKLSAPKPEQASVHRVLGRVREELNEPLQAVREYQQAAELNPSEQNLFDWASELLLHRGVGPSIEVFKKGHDLYPTSARTLLGLAAALYSQASYEAAARYVVEASDLNPSDTSPYLFMGRMISAQAIKSAAISNRLARFAELQAGNAQANYFYALSLSQQGGPAQSSAEREKVRSLLEKAIRLDPLYAAAYLQLGIVHSDTDDFTGAIAQYKKATELDPKLPEAHYRLALAYKRTGDEARAQEELRLYKESSNTVALEKDRERRAIQQFVFTLQDHPVTAPK